MSTSKPSKGIPVPTKIPTSGRDSGTHSRSSSVSNLTTASDIHSGIYLKLMRQILLKLV